MRIRNWKWNRIDFKFSTASVKSKIKGRRVDYRLQQNADYILYEIS